MKYINDLKNFNIDNETVLALGKFDGVHLGHQKLIKAVIDEAKKRDCESLVLIIRGIAGKNQQPAGNKNTSLEILTDEEEKKKLQKLGVDNVVICEFNDELRTTSAEDFLDNIILKKLNAKVIVAGPDVRFGYQGKGDAAFLKEQEQKKDFSLIIIEKETYKGEIISSSRIKNCIAAGDYKQAQAMLGGKI